MFIIDFDDTLFNTAAFKRARQTALVDVGVSEALCEATYQEARTSADGLFTYSDERHAAVLAKHGFSEESTIAALASVTARVPQFLDETAFLFLETLKKYKQPLILVSLGDPSFQELKVKGSGVDRYFDRLFMVDETKEQVIRELLSVEKSEKVWFINDKVAETQKIVETFPGVQAILKVSSKIPVEEYQASSLPYFTSLVAITEYVARTF